MLTDPAQHAPQKTYTPGRLYSQHDVVGDPEACFINRLDGRGAPSGIARGVGF
jgi:hypothetical protein